MSESFEDLVTSEDINTTVLIHIETMRSEGNNPMGTLRLIPPARLKELRDELLRTATLCEAEAEIIRKALGLPDQSATPLTVSEIARIRRFFGMT